MEVLAGKLEEFGLKKFLNDHRHELCKTTVNQRKIASFLTFDPDQIANIMAPSDNFSRCCKLYELIEKTTTPSNFLRALEDTNNSHVLKFLKSVLMDSSISSGQNRSTSRGLWFNVPESIDSFCGREDFLSQLHDKLQHRDNSTREVTVLSQVKIVSGLGGIGKTQTARRYISQYFEFYNNFIWIDSDTDNSMRNSFLKLASEIQIHVKAGDGKSRKIEEIVKEIYNKICEGGKSNLIVFDNAEDYQSCKNFFPYSLHPNLKKPVILATSRNQEWISPTGKIQVLPLDVMTDDESLEFILKELEIEDSPEFREESKEFIQLIGGLPLALQQAVAYIKQEKELRKFLGTSYKINDYVKEFKSSMEKFLTFSPVPQPTRDSSPTVFVTWDVTLVKILDLEDGEDSIRILMILTFLYADKIPLSFLRDLLSEMEERKYMVAFKLLEKYSLIKTNYNNFSVSLHRQLQFVILQSLKKSNTDSKVVMTIAVKCIGILRYVNLSKTSDIFLSLHQIVNNHFDLDNDVNIDGIPVTETFLEFMWEFGLLLYYASRYSESLAVYKKVYSKECEIFGENHPKPLASQSKIAMQLSHLGRQEEALNLYKENLEKKEIHPDFGPDHPSTITVKQSMATALQHQEKYGEALELLEQCLDQSKKVHGEDHPKTLTTQRATASLHLNLCDFPKALALFEHVERKQIEIYGPDHQEVLGTKHEKAVTLYRMGKFEEASKLFKEVHEKKIKTLGETHLDSILTLSWIAQDLVREGKLAEALEVYEKVYEIRRDNLGQDHPDTIKTKQHVADVLEQQGKYGEALELLEECLEKWNKIQGENANHLKTILLTQKSIATLHFRQGDFQKAFTLFERVERGQVEILGSDDINLLWTKHNKAEALCELGRFQEASKIFFELYNRWKQLVGENHVDTVNTLEWFARTLEQLNKFSEAFILYKKVYEFRKTEFGEEHPQTVLVRSRIIRIEFKINSRRGGGE